MTVSLVGADRLGNIPKKLEEFGYNQIAHWSGRKAKTRNQSISSKIDMVLVFSDFVSHGLMDAVKEQAKRRGLSIVFAKRRTSNLKKVLINNA